MWFAPRNRPRVLRCGMDTVLFVRITGSDLGNAASKRNGLGAGLSARPNYSRGASTRSVPGRGLEPRYNSSPGRNLRAAHWCLQPEQHLAASKREATRAALYELRRCGWHDFRRHQPIRASLRQGSLRAGDRGVSFASDTCNREFEERPKLLLGSSHPFQNITSKPNTRDQE